MKIALTVSLMASLFAGCAQYDQGGADSADDLDGVLAHNAYKGRGQEVRLAMQTVGCTNVVLAVEDAAEPYVCIDLADGSKIRLAWDLAKTGEESGSLMHQCRRLKQAMDAGVTSGPMIWLALEYGSTSRILAEAKDGWNVYEASECIRRGDAGMSNGDELEAITWYKEAVKRGSALGRLKEKVASHALSDATAEPSPASIDYEICRTACTMRCSGRLVRVNERLLERYAQRPVFSIADAPKLSHEECHRFACELAVIGNDNAIHYLYTRKLIEVNDTTNGGMLHHAAAAGHVRIVDWLVGVCRADPKKIDDRGKSPSDWVKEEIKTCDGTRRKQLQAVLESLKKWMNMKEEQ